MTDSADPLIDCHFHWYPREVEEALNKVHGTTRLHSQDWYDLEFQLDRMDRLGRRVDVVTSAGPFCGLFTDTDLARSREVTRLYNETMAEAARTHPGRVWGTCVLPLQDTDVALAELDYAVNELGLVAVNMPGRFGEGENIDEARLEPLYDRVEELGVTLFVHPNDEAFEEILQGYDGALYLSLGRVIDVSVSAYRLVLSGIMERHPGLKVLMSHTGGALPYQAGRMDKNSTAAGLPQPPSTYLKRMYTDTVSPHTMGVRFALDFYGPDHVLYGDDYPCWDPDAALRIVGELDLAPDVSRKVSSGNARALFGLSPSADATGPLPLSATAAAARPASAAGAAPLDSAAGALPLTSPR
jgi:aminocarboxymuconate-semialdehyde decarboxylase